jgi:hypothetical protein
MSGEIPVLLDNYPELGLFRDIVFTFKLLQVPTGDGLPDLQPWMATDAAFAWKYKQVGVVLSSIELMLVLAGPGGAARLDRATHHSDLFVGIRLATSSSG